MRTILIEKRINICAGAMKGNVHSEMLFPVLARATRALLSVQSLARVVFSGVCSGISLGSEFLYLINSCVGILSSLDASAS